MLITQEETFQEVKIIKIKSTKNELIIEIDLKETFGGKEVNINHINMYILHENMISDFKKGNSLSSSETIEKKTSNDVYYSKYPIIAEDISVYIPEKASGGQVIAQTATNIGSKVV